MKTKVREIMTPQVATVQRDAPLQEVARILAKDHAGVVVVLDEQGSPAGIITDAELFPRMRNFGFTLHLYSLFGEPVELNALGHRYESASRLKARDVMCTHLNAVDLESDLRKLIQWMLERNLQRVVITQGNQVAGVVTRADIASRLLQAGSEVRMQTEESQT